MAVEAFKLLYTNTKPKIKNLHYALTIGVDMGMTNIP